MDRSKTPAPDCSAAVRTARPAALDLLLPPAAGECRESTPAPATRRTVPGLSVLRQPPDGSHAGSQPQAHSAADADSRNRSSLSETVFEPSGGGPRDLPVLAARRLDRTAQPGLEHRYYIHSDAWRLPLSGGRDGLVQPLRAQLGTLQYDGDRFLSGCTRGGIPLRPTGNLEFGSRGPIYLCRISGAIETARHPDQHGWTGPCSGQRFHRAPVAQLEIRTDLSWLLRQRSRFVPSARSVLPFLQLSAPTPGARLPHTGRPVPAPVNEETVMIQLGDAVPQTPWDLTQFSSRVDGFSFLVCSDCRTIVELDRRIGQRRDATR